MLSCTFDCGALQIKAFGILIKLSKAIILNVNKVSWKQKRLFDTS